MLPNFNFINKKTNYLFSKFHIFLKCIYKEKKVWKFADKEMDRWTDGQTDAEESYSPFQ